MQLRDGDNLGKGFCTSACAACAKPFPKIVPMAKLHSLIAKLDIAGNVFPLYCVIKLHANKVLAVIGNKTTIIIEFNYLIDINVEQ